MRFLTETARCNFYIFAIYCMRNGIPDEIERSIVQYIKLWDRGQLFCHMMRLNDLFVELFIRTSVDKIFGLPDKLRNIQDLGTLMVLTAPMDVIRMTMMLAKAKNPIRCRFKLDDTQPSYPQERILGESLSPITKPNLKIKNHKNDLPQRSNFHPKRSYKNNFR